MRTTLLAPLVSLGMLVTLAAATDGARQASGPASSTKAPGGAVRDRFVGTWKLVEVERRDKSGRPIPPSAATAQRIGYIVYDPAGYMAVSIMPVGRKKYAGPQPTEDEALQAITGYAAYFGTFTANQAEGVVTHHLQGSINPGMAPEQKRVYSFAGNRLTLQPPAAADGSQSRLTWERIPDLPNLTADQRRFIGFWKLVSNERRNERGELVSSNPGQTGYIIYTPAGFMTVHMIQPDRKPYAGATPTPDEARQAIRTYTNYFGPFYLHETDGYVVHDQVGTLNVGRNGPSPQQRFYQIAGNRLTLHPPLTYTPDGHTIQGTIVWEHVEPQRGTR